MSEKKHYTPHEFTCILYMHTFKICSSLSTIAFPRNRNGNVVLGRLIVFVYFFRSFSGFALLFIKHLWQSVTDGDLSNGLQALYIFNFCSFSESHKITSLLQKITALIMIKLKQTDVLNVKTY